MKNYLVTGIHGMAGSVIADLILETQPDAHVWGMERRTTVKNRENTQHLIGNSRFHLLSGDLSDQSSLLRCLEESSADYVVNAGAQSFVGLSWKIPVETCDITGMGVLRLLEAVRQFKNNTGKQVRMVQFSSSEMLGATTNVSVKNSRGIIPKSKETDQLYPRSVYGSAKAFGHHLVKNYRESYDIHVSSAIFFNMEGPRRGKEFVTRKITSGVAAIFHGKQQNIILGPDFKNVRRDWGSCKDYMRGVLLMLEQDKADDYIFATGESHTIGELLDIAFARIGMIDWETQGLVQVSDEFKRANELEILCGDATKAKTVLGWQPTMTFNQIVEEMVKNDLLKSVDGDIKTVQERMDKMKKIFT